MAANSHNRPLWIPVPDDNSGTEDTDSSDDVGIPPVVVKVDNEPPNDFNVIDEAHVDPLSVEEIQKVDIDDELNIVDEADQSQDEKVVAHASQSEDEKWRVVDEVESDMAGSPKTQKGDDEEFKVVDEVTGDGVEEPVQPKKELPLPAEQPGPSGMPQSPTFWKEFVATQAARASEDVQPKLAAAARAAPPVVAKKPQHKHDAVGEVKLKQKKEGKRKRRRRKTEWGAVGMSHRAWRRYKQIRDVFIPDALQLPPGRQVLLFFGDLNTYPFSNMAIKPFEFERGPNERRETVIFKTTEHEYKHSEAFTQGRHDLAEFTVNTSNPKKVKTRIAREFAEHKPTPPDKAKWEKKKYGVMYDALRKAFNQNSAAMDCLIASFPRFLVEASLTDKCWGVGTAVGALKDLAAPGWEKRVTDWGENRMGYLLMRVRKWAILHKPNHRFIRRLPPPQAPLPAGQLVEALRPPRVLFLSDSQFRHITGIERGEIYTCSGGTYGETIARAEENGYLWNLQYRYDIVLIFGGTNDIRPTKNATASLATLRRFVEDAAPLRVVVAPPIPYTARAGSYAQDVERALCGTHAELIDWSCNPFGDAVQPPTESGLIEPFLQLHVTKPGTHALWAVFCNVVDELRDVRFEISQWPYGSRARGNPSELNW